MKMDRKKWLWLAGALLLLAALKLALLGWWWRSQAAAPKAETVACTVDAACALPGGGELRFAGAPLEGKPFEIVLTGEVGDAPTAEFAMADMDMGFNRYRFVREDGRWVARVQLPVCVSQSRNWLMTLTLGERKLVVPFATQAASS